jgi:hypothetical protein
VRQRDVDVCLEKLNTDTTTAAPTKKKEDGDSDLSYQRIPRMYPKDTDFNIRHTTIQYFHRFASGSFSKSLMDEGGQ